MSRCNSADETITTTAPASPARPARSASANPSDPPSTASTSISGNGSPAADARRSSAQAASASATAAGRSDSDASMSARMCRVVGLSSTTSAGNCWTSDRSGIEKLASVVSDFLDRSTGFQPVVEGTKHGLEVRATPA